MQSIFSVAARCRNYLGNTEKAERRAGALKWIGLNRCTMLVLCALNGLQGAEGGEIGLGKMMALLQICVDEAPSAV
jgi:hypothetical protein